jgi:hypothetical protein
MSERFASRDLGDELIIHDAVTDSVHVLSKTARVVYEMSRAGKGVDEIVEVVRQSFTISDGQDVAKDVLKCLEQLRSKQLVE